MTAKKTVLITGAGGDLGRAFTRAFIGQGYAVAGIDFDQAALTRFSSAVDELRGDGLALDHDLRDWRQIQEAVDAVMARFGRIDVIINNATVRTVPNFKPLEECTEAELDEMLAVGPQAALGVMRAAFPHLKVARGTVINIGSAEGVRPSSGLGAYAMAKAALQSLTRTAAKEWGLHGIRVNGILPFAMTEKLAEVLAADPDLLPRVAPPLGRIGDAESDIGAVALFLASDAAGYITGQNIPVDGGILMH